MSDKPIPEKTITEKKMLNINIEYSQLDKFCRQLITRSRDIAKTHDALITLETFITNFGRSQQGSESYNAVESLIKTFTEQTRQTLLEQKTTELLHALYKQDIDAIAIFTPPDSHREIGLAAMESGKHLFIDKPLAVNVNDCEALVQKASQSPVIAMLGFNFRWHRLLRRSHDPASGGCRTRVCTSGLSE